MRTVIILTIVFYSAIAAWHYDNYKAKRQLRAELQLKEHILAVAVSTNEKLRGQITTCKQLKIEPRAITLVK